MINTMEWIALFAGFVIGLLGYLRVIDYLLIILNYSPFASKQSYENMYDAADDETTYKYFKQRLSGIESYADYLRLHKLVKRSSFRRFRIYYDSLVKMVIGMITPLVMLPAVIFWSNWYLYLLGVVIAVLLLAIYKRYVSGARSGYYQRMMIIAVLRDYLKEKSPK